MKNRFSSRLTQGVSLLLAGSFVVDGCLRWAGCVENVTNEQSVGSSPVGNTDVGYAEAASSGQIGRAGLPVEESARPGLERALAAILTTVAPADAPFNSRIQAATLEFYRQLGYRDAWRNSEYFRGDGAGDLSRKLAALIKEHGVTGDKLPVFNPVTEIPGGCPVSQQDLEVTLMLFDAAILVRFGSRRLPSLWDHYPVSNEQQDQWFQAAVGQLTAARDNARMFLDKVAPQNAVYQSLVDFYRDQARALTRRDVVFEPIKLPKGVRAVKVGDGLPDAGRLAELLVMDGALRRSEKVEGLRDVGESAGIFTAELSAALKEFQRANLLNADGVLGSQTLAVLNVGPEEKIQRLVVNIQRARQLPDDMGERFVVANISSAEVEAYDHGRLREKMRIVFGQSAEGMRTPIFHDVMRYVVFRPYWRVPPGIVADEIAPETAEDPMSFYRKGYEIVENYADASALDPTWENLAIAAEGQLRIRQKPGPGNALGLVKFLFPNPHSVYMHDTPLKHLFAKDRRDFSHGCIRLQHPEKMARYVLGGQGWDEDRIKQAMEGESRQSISIAQPIRVYIVYFTAWPDALENGRVLWKPDIYGRDEAAWLNIRQTDGVIVD